MWLSVIAVFSLRYIQAAAHHSDSESTGMLFVVLSYV